MIAKHAEGNNVIETLHPSTFPNIAEFSCKCPTVTSYKQYILIKFRGRGCTHRQVLLTPGEHESEISIPVIDSVWCENRGPFPMS